MAIGSKTWSNSSMPAPQSSRRCSTTSSIRPAPPNYGIGCSRRAYRLAGGEWQGVWARRDGVQAGAPECSLRGTESGPAGADRGSKCGSERAVECRPRPVRMQAATAIDQSKCSHRVESFRDMIADTETVLHLRGIRAHHDLHDAWIAWHHRHTTSTSASRKSCRASAKDCAQRGASWRGATCLVMPA
jgi:hypothetical protein